MFAKIASLLAIIWTLFQMYTAGFGFLHVMLMRPFHVAFALAITFLSYTSKGSKVMKTDEEAPKEARITWYDFVLAMLSLGVGLYMFLSSERIISRIPFIDDVLIVDIIVGLLLIVLILEAGRRVFGLLLPALAVIFLAYQFFGQNLPGVLSHRGIRIDQFIDMQVLSADGIFGTPIGVSTNTVFYFLIFGSFLEISGGGKFFIDLAVRLTGRFRGGPAKTAIVASSLMGSVSGSAVGNVAGTGVFTIPLMKSIGYSPVFAGAVEAVASTGGQIMPPIMGAAAFVLAQYVGIPYSEVVLAAIIPALLFYIALFIGVDIRAKEKRLLGVDVTKNSLGKDWLKRFHLIIPLATLIYMIFQGYSLQLSALVATLVAIPVGWLKKETRIGLKIIVSALEATGRKAIVVAVPSALAGIIVGVVAFSGLGMKFSAFLIQLSGGNLYLTLVLVMIGCLIMGMAMPTTAAYILTAILMAPALTKLGVAPIAAHMFIFYFAIMSMITPPIALSAYAGAGIAGADLMKTGFQAWFLALSGYVIPFAFVANNALLMQGSPMEILRTSGLAILGAYCVAKGVISERIPWWLHAAYVLAGILLISPDWKTDIAGIIVFAVSMMFQRSLEHKDLTLNKVSMDN